MVRGTTAVVAIALAGALAAAPPNASELKTAVDAGVSEWWPTPTEKRFDEIGWTPDLRSARKLAAERQRPVFLFTMDGRVNLGRC
jgi:hypothetical protein